jgi:hypothetical protein
VGRILPHFLGQNPAHVAASLIQFLDVELSQNCRQLRLVSSAFCDSSEKCGEIYSFKVEKRRLSELSRISELTELAPKSELAPENAVKLS